MGKSCFDPVTFFNFIFELVVELAAELAALTIGFTINSPQNLLVLPYRRVRKETSRAIKSRRQMRRRRR